MTSKHFINDPTKLVADSLKSCTLINPTIAYQPDHKIVYRKINDPRDSKVSVISGGGSGHEPGFAGYVGKGLLDAAVAGSIFASPSAEQIRRSLRYVPTKAGVLVLIMNYTGDVLNFGMAVGDAKASGVKAELFAVGDDVAVGRTKNGKVDRRGLAGTVLVMKACGALAEMGHSLEDVCKLARQVADNIVTVGASLDHVCVPGRAAQAEGLTTSSIELGMGIHNESGCDQVEMELPVLVDTMLRQLLDTNDSDRGFVYIEPKEEVVLLVNNLGAVSALELGAIVTEVRAQLKEKYELLPVRILAGPFLTSLNGPGFSISLLKASAIEPRHGIALLDLLDYPCDAAGWPNILSKTNMTADSPDDLQNEESRNSATVAPSHLVIDSGILQQSLKAALNRLVAAEPDITRFDTIVGDGDCGANMAKGANAILLSLDEASGHLDAIQFIAKIKSVVETSMDGTSGALLTILLSGLIQGLRALNKDSSQTLDTTNWSAALQHGIQTLARYTPAKLGDRTIMDAVIPFANVLTTSLNIDEAVVAAKNGADQTKDLKASFGRSVYIGSESQWIGKIPDPGAYAASEFLQGLAEAISKSR